MILNQINAASLLSITPRSLRQTDAPRLEGGKYDGQILVRWFIARELAKLEMRLVEKTPEIERLRCAQADLAEIRLANEKRVLIPAGEVQKTFNAVALVFDRMSREVQLAGHNAAFEIMQDALKESYRVFEVECAATPAIDPADIPTAEFIQNEDTKL